MSGINTLFLALIATLLNRQRNYKPLLLPKTLNIRFIADNLKVILNFRILKDLVTLWSLLSQLGYILMLFSIWLDCFRITAIMNAGQVLGHPSLGLLANRVGRNNLSASVLLLISIFLWAFCINATTFPAIAAFAIILGLFIGIGSVMSQSLAADIVQDERKLPAAWSYLNIS